MRQLANFESVSKKIPLEDAFIAFNKVSERLTESYQLLEQQVIGLTAELSRANTEKLQHLSEKEQLAEQLAGLLESLPGAVIVLDRMGDIIRANACAREWLATDLIHQNWETIQQTYLSRSEELGNEHSLNDGRVVALSETILSSQQGCVILLSDITQQRDLHQQLEHKKKLAAMGEFSAGLAHQIRTPLSSALLYASQLNTVEVDPEKTKKYSKKLLERLRDVNTQVSDMLSYAHKGHFKKATYNLLNISMQLSAKYQAESQRLSFEMINITPDCLVEISKDTLFGAIDNLINNAFDSLGEEGNVSCLLAIKNNRLEISVVDQGTGLSATEVTQVFEPFYTNKSKGTGLGLAVVNEVVKAHAGKVECQSTPGVGSAFTMVLPVVVVANQVQELEEST